MKLLLLTTATILFVFTFVFLMFIEISIFEHFEYNLNNEQTMLIILLNILISGIIAQKIL